ncbi:hypothetical protein R3P38DRAFT_2937972 [Favolaschia claudopus]|uniref:F-box domain-containing protein n=1 Tax=Favolaschia claudopus TaxID=2862362 RepID=A0AAW0BRP4_9AGAR
MSTLAGGVTSRFPEELWLEIVHQAPQESLLRISLVDRALRRISSPFLFSRFTLHPYNLGPYGNRSYEEREVFALDEATQNREMEHLNFRCSAEIAPLVRLVNIAPLDEPKRAKGTDSPSALINLFFLRIPAFIHLATFRAYNLIFTHIALRNLCTLPALTQLEVVACVVTGWVDEPNFNLHQLITARLGPSPRASSPLDPWIRLIDADHLVDLSLTIPADFWATIAQYIPTFPCLTRLELLSRKCPSLPISTLVSLLVKFPSVTDLSLGGNWYFSYQAQYCDVLPSIQRFFGTFEFLPLIIGRPTLTRIGSSCPGSYWLQRVSAMDTESNVTSLTLYSYPLDLAEFCLLSKVFPALTCLDLEFEHDSGHGSSFSEITSFLRGFILSPPVSPCLDSLRITWDRQNWDEMLSSEEEDEAEVDESESEDEDDEEEDEEDDELENHIDRDETKTSSRKHARLTKAEAVAGLRLLMAKFSALRSLQIEGHAFLFHALRRSDGTIEENIAVTACDFNRFYNGDDSDASDEE